jgi:hypothetical protein
MIHLLRKKWEEGRRFFNLFLTRGPALLRRMGIPFSDVPVEKRGLILIQIDGLSHPRLRRALAENRLPFLKRQIRKGNFRLHRFSSEIPTSTPAFQGGLFYGDNDNIPGFQFYDKREKYYYRMGHSDCAYRIEKSFKNPGLLRGGSVFSSVFTGEAEAALFVFSTLLAPQRWRFVFRVWDILVLSFLNILVGAKIVGLIALELFLAVYDSLRWFIQRGEWRRELEFIALRVALTIVTRELITLGAVIDIYRRVPIIYVNFLGYDEHAHQRGPDSRVALWTLKGIDRCIARIYKASLYSERNYDVYVLSDHGQSPVQPFELVAGETLAEFLQSHVQQLLVENPVLKDSKMAQLSMTLEGLQRIAKWMPRLFRYPIRAYVRRTQKKLVKLSENQNLEALLDVLVVSSGPVAFIYWNNYPDPLPIESIEEMYPGLVARLLQHDGIAMISARLANGDVVIYGRHGKAVVGEVTLRSDGILPCDRFPHRRRILRQIRRVTLFSRAGDLCIWGGGAPVGNVSYSYEFGGHSGWTPDETDSFIIAPGHVEFDFSLLTRHPQFYDYFLPYSLFAGEQADTLARTAQAS